MNPLRKMPLKFALVLGSYFRAYLFTIIGLYV